jgi:hypothetical protein
MWESSFGLSLAFLLARLTVLVAGKRLSNWSLDHMQGSILPNLRESLLKKAENWDATHVLFLDTDQVFPADIYEQLRQWNKPFVACGVATKSVPAACTAKLAPAVSWNPTTETEPLRKVWRVGCGVALLRLADFRNIIKPRFLMRWRGETEEYQGEDWGLCDRMDQAGIPIYVDTKASWQVEHTGRFHYNLHMLAVQEEMRSAEQERETGSNDEGGRTRSELREEAAHSAVGG